MEKYYCQLVAKKLLKMMCSPQDDFQISPGYLHGLNKEKFINGYKETFCLFSRIYKDIYSNPELFGCPLLDVTYYHQFDPKVVSMKITPIYDFLHALMESGRLENGICVISADRLMEFKKFFNLTKLPLLFDRLNEYGFLFQGWDGKAKLSSNSSFTLDYPNNPYSLTVLKAASEKTHKIKGDKTSKTLDEHFYTMSYHLFYDDSETVLPYTHEDYKKFLSEEQFTFIHSFNEFMESKGMKTNWSGLLRINYILPNGKEDKECYICYADYRYGLRYDNKLILRFRFNKIEKYQNIIDKLPEHIKKAITEVPCEHCSSDGDPKKERPCKNRICHMLDSNQNYRCTKPVFKFTDLKTNDMEYYKEFYELEYNW